MSITFRVTSDEEANSVSPAQISVRQLVAFRHFARDHHILVDDLPDGEDITRTFTFEARICGFALAVMARLFDFAGPAIAVLDEAQFRQRQVRFFKDRATGELMLALSSTMAGSIDLDLAIGNAYAVMKALDLKPQSIGDLPLAVLRDRLAEPRVRARFLAHRVDHCLPRFDHLAAIVAHEQEPRLVWA
jgi:hypothetical protein